MPRGRFLVYHGLNYTAASFVADSTYLSIVTGLQGQGFEVTVPSVTGEGTGTAQATYLQGRFNADATGANEKATILADYDTLKATIPNDGAPLYLLGISWGGLHVAHIAGNRTVSGFVMHLPALDPNNLTEFSSYSLSTLETFNTSAIAAIPSIASRGWCSYADDDTRVGHVAQPAFITATGCTAKHYTTLGHTTNATTVTDMLTFTTALP